MTHQLLGDAMRVVICISLLVLAGIFVYVAMEVWNTR